MWEKIKLKIETLKKMDLECQLFGAGSHKYKLNPVVNHDDIKKVEEKLGIALPQELKDFYTQVGNGVAGPHYGLKTLENLSTSRNPDKPYQGQTYFEELSDDYEDYEDGLVEGVVYIIDEGCGHTTALVIAGENIGQVVSVECGGDNAYDHNQNFLEYYNEWLDKNIAKFDEI